MAQPKLCNQLSLVISTSAVHSNPSTCLLEQVMKSLLVLPELHECKKIIVCDGYKILSKPKSGKDLRKSGYISSDLAQRYEAYKRALQGLVDSGLAAFNNTELLVLPQHTGFGYGIKAALDHHHTPYVLVVQAATARPPGSHLSPSWGRGSAQRGSKAAGRFSVGAAVLLVR